MELVRYLVFCLVIGGLGVTCSTREAMIAASNPAVFDGFLQDVINLDPSIPAGTSSFMYRSKIFILPKKSSLK